MKRYVRPMMYAQMFVANEYVAACGDVTKFACLNMNSMPTIYYDKDLDGILDNSEKIDSNRFTAFNKMNDCGTTGSLIAGAHEITDAEKNSKELRVIVDYGSQQVAAIIDKSTKDNHFKDSPHFVSLKVANHS